MRRTVQRVEEARRKFKNDKRVVLVRCDSKGETDFLLVCRVLREAKHYVVEMLVEQYDRNRLSMRLKLLAGEKYKSRKEAERDVLAKFEPEQQADFLIPIRE